MADHTPIEWSDATWNIVTGCTLVSEGCCHCYAARLAATRLKNHPSRQGLARLNAAGEAKFSGEVRFNAQWLDQPLRWRRPRKIFVCAHGDLFHETVPDEWIDQVFAVMALAPQHSFQILTKRPERMREYLTRPVQGPGAGRVTVIDEFGSVSAGTDVEQRLRTGALTAQMMKAPAAALNAASAYLTRLYGKDGYDGFMPRWPLPNVWLGTSVEDQATADARIPHLLATPAAVRFVSAEPLLGPVDLTNIRPAESDRVFGFPAVDVLWGSHHLEGIDPRLQTPPGPARLDWVIVGGESGPDARPMHPDWARSLRDQCAAAGVAFLFKQWGAWVAFYDRDLDDPDWRACPKVDGQMGQGAERYLNLAGGCGFHGEHVVAVRHVGKSAAGRLLDGIEHNGFPS